VKILIADDESVSRRMLHALLAKWGYEVVSAEDGDAAWEVLKTPDAPRMALLDWMMPGQNGVDVCRTLRKQRPEPYTYILLLTARDSKDGVVEGLESGADDYLTKPFNPQELKARIRVGLRLLDLEDNLVQAREAMRFKAMHDALTGVWNRGAILESLDREVWRSRREGISLGVLIADLDHFKSINDTHGHQVGDAVLRDVSKGMKTNVRPYDSVGRYGGEEFLILLPGCNGSEAREKAERLREAISGAPIATSAGDLKVTMSIGGAATADWPQQTPDQILQMADAALYRAKRDGRNRTAMACSSDLDEAQQSTLQLSSPGPRNE
jgi:two-component system cell cycle response regulator